MDIKKIILDLVFPKYCVGCKMEGIFICQTCFDKIPINVFDKSQINKTYKFLDLSYVASDFNNAILQTLMHQYKYNFIYDLHIDLAKLLIKYLNNSDLIKNNFDFVLPVPLSKKRELWRGFNQVEIFAKIIGDNFNVRFNKSILRKNIHNRPQVGLSAQQRLNNAKGIYQVTHLIKGKNILLIDDVTTTGATLDECAKELKKMGANRVVGLVIAQG